jgi:DNA-binding SARP family transcriptional activator
MPQLALALLGSFQVTLDGQPIARLTSRKAQALLAYVAVEAARPHQREALAALLWPDLPDRDALRKLRYALSDLRQALGDQLCDGLPLQISRNIIKCNPAGACTIDVARFEQHLSAATERVATRPDSGPTVIEHLRAAIDLFHGSFLEEFAVDSSAFEEWALLKRQQFHWQLMGALQQLASIYEAQCDYDQAQLCARRLLELEPWREEVHRQLMRTLALAGQRSLALAQYQTCIRCLQQELGVAPEEATTALYAAIRDGMLPDHSVREPSHATIARSPDRHDAAAAFVDRTHELNKLERLLGAALAGQGGIALITGEVGSGKTALANEFARRAMTAHSDLLVARGQCYVQSGDPYLPFRELLQMLAGTDEASLAGSAISAQHAERLWEARPTVVQELIDHAPGLIDSFIPRGTLLRRTADRRDRREAPAGGQALGMTPGWIAPPSTAVAGLPVEPNQQVAAVLFALARRHPLILILDDIHWADSRSIGMLSYLGRRLAGNRMLIVGAYQPAFVAPGYAPVALDWRPAPEASLTPALHPAWERHPLERVVHELQRRFGDIRVDLNQSDGRQFVAAYLDSAPNRQDAAFRELLYRNTAGNPLFVLELLNSMKTSTTLLQEVPGQWMAASAGDEERLPPRVEAAIAERIGCLPPAWQAMLSIASVEGQEFTAEVIACVQATNLADLTGALSKLHGLVYNYGLEWAGPQGTQRLSRYRFRHGLVQKYLYYRLDLAERAQLHQAVAQALAGLYGQDVAALPTAMPALERQERVARVML